MRHNQIHIRVISQKSNPVRIGPCEIRLFSINGEDIPRNLCVSRNA